jgi:hypothetical protein
MVGYVGKIGRTMQRRDFLLASLLLLPFSAKSFATVNVCRRPYKEIPGWMKVFFERYWKFHNQNFFDHSQVWPKDLTKELFAQIAEPRDFYQSFSGVKRIPQFQWVYEVEGEEVTSAKVEWYNLNEPEKFRSRILKHFPYLPKDGWSGITWDPANDTIACHSFFNEIVLVKPQGSPELYVPLTIQSEFFAKKKKSHIEYSVYQRAGATLETYRDDKLEMNRLFDQEGTAEVGMPRTLELRRQIYKEFHIFEASMATAAQGKNERLYFP